MTNCSKTYWPQKLNEARSKAKQTFGQATGHHDSLGHSFYAASSYGFANGEGGFSSISVKCKLTNSIHQS